MSDATEKRTDGSVPNSVAHKDNVNPFGVTDGLVPWRPERKPELKVGFTTGRLRGCGYCGSAHPADIAAAIRAGAIGRLADFKYGWPHKAYFDGVPNPHAGALEYKFSTNRPGNEFPIKVQDGFDERTGEPKYVYYGEGEPSPSTTHAKFYTVHLQDASPGDRELIEQRLGLNFRFENGLVYWKTLDREWSV